MWVHSCRQGGRTFGREQHQAKLVQTRPQTLVAYSQSVFIAMPFKKINILVVPPSQGVVLSAFFENGWWLFWKRLMVCVYHAITASSQGFVSWMSCKHIILSVSSAILGPTTHIFPFFSQTPKSWNLIRSPDGQFLHLNKTMAWGSCVAVRQWLSFRVDRRCHWPGPQGFCYPHFPALRISPVSS